MLRIERKRENPRYDFIAQNNNLFSRLSLRRLRGILYLIIPSSHRLPGAKNFAITRRETRGLSQSKHSLNETNWKDEKRRDIRRPALVIKQVQYALRVLFCASTYSLTSLKSRYFPSED